MKIIILQKRGLGNQLFQYAAGLYFAQKYNASMSVVCDAPERAVSFGRPRGFMLSKFRISTPIRELTLWDQLLCSIAPSKRPVAASARWLSRTEIYRQPVSEDRTFLAELPIRSSTQTIYIEGNFQAHQFADSVEAQLRQDLCLIEPAKGGNLEVLERIKSAENSVSLHVRRGDYALWSGGPRVLPMTYYDRSIDLIRQKVAEPKFFVFSDDMEYARQNLSKYDNMEFVSHNDEHNPQEDLRLMAACRHHIVANSTLSWWGAWLNPNPNKLVCAPAGWGLVDPAERLPDLIPESWLQVITD